MQRMKLRHRITDINEIKCKYDTIWLFSMGISPVLQQYLLNKFSWFLYHLPLMFSWWRAWRGFTPGFLICFNQNMSTSPTWLLLFVWLMIFILTYSSKNSYSYPKNWCNSICFIESICTTFVNMPMAQYHAP